MDETSRGIATAAPTLQSVMLQALVSKGALTRAEAFEVVDAEGPVVGAADLGFRQSRLTAIKRSS